MKKSARLGIKRKFFLGFVVLGMILFFSSVIALFEFNRMNSALSGIIEDNIKAINLARGLLTMSEDYNSLMLDNLSDTEEFYISGQHGDEFEKTYNDLKTGFTTRGEQTMADSVYYAYAAYMQVAREADAVWPLGYEARKGWYFSRLQPFYKKLRGYIQSLTLTSQNALADNSKAVQDTFYRSLMPSVASVAVGIIIVMLFNVFLNHYLINPILKITTGIQNYRKYGKEYSLEIENTDEISDLNNSVKELIADNQSKKL
ncbi:MAG: hypothetical protein HUJ92_00380 [Bacteroidales bacterium]|nr:hypothetical protein [Bacteroidales bacterium]